MQRLAQIPVPVERGMNLEELSQDDFAGRMCDEIWPVREFLNKMDREDAHIEELFIRLRTR